MSPQQALGENPTVQDDIYALGASIYDLLSGKPPFYSGDILAQLREISPPPISRRRQDLGNTGEPIPVEWERTVAACLSKDPTARPRSAGEVAGLLGLGTVRATSHGVSASTARVSPVGTRRRVPWFRVLAGVFVVGLLGGMAFFVYNTRRNARLQEEVTRRNEAEASRLIAQREMPKPPPVAPPPVPRASPAPVRSTEASKQMPAPPPDRSKTASSTVPREAAAAAKKTEVASPPPPQKSAPQSVAQTPTQPSMESASAPPPAVAEKANPPPEPPPPEKPKLHPAEQDSMANLSILVQFARDPATLDRPAIVKRIDRVISAYHLSQSEIRAVHVERWRTAIDGSAELGSVPAMLLLSEGLAESDPVAAFKAGLKAAMAGNSRSMLDTGRRYRDGRGTQPDPAQARRWLQAAADAGDMEARRVLAYALLQGIGMSADPPAAVEMIRSLSDAGDAVAMDLLGTFYHKGLHGLTKDAERAFRLYTGASELGNLGALANLGVLYIKGEGTAADAPRAASLFRKGAEAGNARCMELLAVCLDDGIGVTKDAAAAEQWRQKAAALSKKE